MGHRGHRASSATAARAPPSTSSRPSTPTASPGSRSNARWTASTLPDTPPVKVVRTPAGKWGKSGECPLDVEPRNDFQKGTYHEDHWSDFVIGDVPGAAGRADGPCPRFRRRISRRRRGRGPLRRRRHLGGGGGHYGGFHGGGSTAGGVRARRPCRRLEAGGFTPAESRRAASRRRVEAGGTMPAALPATSAPGTSDCPPTAASAGVSPGPARAATLRPGIAPRPCSGSVAAARGAAVRNSLQPLRRLRSRLVERPPWRLDRARLGDRGTPGTPATWLALGAWCGWGAGRAAGLLRVRQ